MELPECPVCLQTYDNENTIPRVLPCGHSACEPCLLQIPRRFPDTIRCPACNQLIKLPQTLGPSALPKNIDLLRFAIQQDPISRQTSEAISETVKQASLDVSQHQFIPIRWSDEFYVTWKDWILPSDAVVLELMEENDPCSALRGKFACSSLLISPVNGSYEENQIVSLVRIASSPLNDTILNFSHITHVMEVLNGMTEEERAELQLLLRASARRGQICKVYGMWHNVKDNYVYLVSERNGRNFSDRLVGVRHPTFTGGKDDLPDQRLNSVNGDRLRAFAVIGMELCAAVIKLHLEGVIAGCIAPSCFVYDDIGLLCVDLNGILETGRKVRTCISEDIFAGQQVDFSLLEANSANLLSSCAFASPELLFEILKDEVTSPEHCISAYPVGCGSDIWSLACILLMLLIGKSFNNELVNYINIFYQTFAVNGFAYVDLYMGWMEKVSSLLAISLGVQFQPLQRVLIKCMDIDPGSRATIFDLWRCIRALIIEPEFDTLVHLKGETTKNCTYFCLVLGCLSHLPCEPNKSADDAEKIDEFHDGNEIKKVDVDQGGMVGITGSKPRCRDLPGHLDCITGFATGGFTAAKFTVLLHLKWFGSSCKVFWWLHCHVLVFQFMCATLGDNALAGSLGGRLLSSSFDKTIWVWSLQDFSHLHTFKGHEHRVMAITYVDEEEPLCISGDSGGGIFIWAMSTPLGQEPSKKWYEEKDWRYTGIHALATSGSGYVYTGSGDKTIKAWRIKDCTLSFTLTGHNSVVSTLAVCDGVLYSGSWDGTIRLWCLSDHSPLTVLGEGTTGSVTAVLSLTVDQHIVVAAHDSGYLKVLDTFDLDIIPVLIFCCITYNFHRIWMVEIETPSYPLIWRNDEFKKSTKAQNGTICSLAMEGRWLFVGGWDRTVNVQEISGDEFQIDARAVGSIPCDSVVTALLYCEGKLFVGCANRFIKFRLVVALQENLGRVKKNWNNFTSLNYWVVRDYNRLVIDVNALEPRIQRLSDDQLTAKTEEFKGWLRQGETLADIQVEAFAVVPEAAKRKLGMRHFDVQIVGGAVLHDGCIAQMKTGEGKTLVSTLAAYLNALSGEGFHEIDEDTVSIDVPLIARTNDVLCLPLSTVVTVNDYLAQRDAECMGRVHRFLGLSVGLIQRGMKADERRSNYACDITYTNNSELGFDYLRDNLAGNSGQLVMRWPKPFHFAIVDEVDSVLIDEGRNPLLISGEASKDAARFPVAAKVAELLLVCNLGSVVGEMTPFIATLWGSYSLVDFVLSYQYAAREAEIIAQAGQKYAITISTNMAGRGTDIIPGGNPKRYVSKSEGKSWSYQDAKSIIAESVQLSQSLDVMELERLVEEQSEMYPLGPTIALAYTSVLKDCEIHCFNEGSEVKRLGGLHVIGTSLHESRRIDNQLRGRAGRQGDPGSTRFMVSLRDEMFQKFNFDTEWAVKLISRITNDEDVPIDGGAIVKQLLALQVNAEKYFFGIRKSPVEFDEVLEVSVFSFFWNSNVVLCGSPDFIVLHLH
ncbi:WD40 repeat [Dillenia turbinata]|uniref:chloroplast protein-transporting ATPase n=1 Tax=Dillenia turbinata TaxID=194707 RepID=A0AAN8W4S1_9MAGN